jgi:hypothetical protein
MVFSSLPLRCALLLPLFFPIYCHFLPSIEPLNFPSSIALCHCSLPSTISIFP